MTQNWKISILISFFGLISISLLAQDLAVGEWAMHLPVQNVRAITEVENQIYCGSSSSIFSYDKGTGNKEILDRLDGYSDLTISEIDYEEESQVLIAVYKNMNIDMVKNGQVINVPDIRRKIIGGKQINELIIVGKFAYMSCSFGLVIYDIEAEEFAHSPSSVSTSINQVAIDEANNRIFAATETGIYETSLDNTFISQLQTWELHDETQGIPTSAAKFIVREGDSMYAYTDSTIYQYQSEWETWTPIYEEDEYWVPQDMSFYNGQLLLTEWQETPTGIADARVVIIEGENIFYVTDELRRPMESIIGKDGKLWVGDMWSGLLKRTSSGEMQSISPNGPKTSDVTQMAVSNGNLWVAPGGVEGNFSGNTNAQGLFVYTGSWWSNVNRYTNDALDNIFDIVRVGVNPYNNHVFLGSCGGFGPSLDEPSWGGIIEFDTDYKLVDIYNTLNTPMSSTSEANYEDVRISGISFDDQGNLWASAYKNPEPIIMRTLEGDWHTFRPEGNGLSLSDFPLLDMVVDDYNQKWIIVDDNRGLLVCNSGENLISANDDTYRQLDITDGNTLKSSQANCIVKDLEGDIWVGTGDGAIYYSCFGEISDAGFNCPARRPEVTVDRQEFTFYLLAEEIVQAVAVDDANRKWFGTTNGVWLMSEDGTEQLAHFNEDNSPLLSNNVVDIAINRETGQVFFGTDKGIMSYKGEAIAGGRTFENVLVYPNPVRPDYEGMIAIKGLALNADVKITDVSGKLVYETNSLGGQAVWDGYTYEGVKASSGVYLVFSNSQDGMESYVAKFAIVN